MICCSTTRGVFTMTRVFLHQEFCIPIFKVSQGLIFGAYQFRNCSPQNNMSISLKKKRSIWRRVHPPAAPCFGEVPEVELGSARPSLDGEVAVDQKIQGILGFSVKLPLCWFEKWEKKQVPNIEKNQALQTCLHFYDLLMFPKIVGFLPKTSIWRGFSIIFTIHFGGPPLFFGNTHLLMVIYHRE